MSAIPASERDRHLATIRRVFGAVKEIDELSDGYAFRMANDTRLLEMTASFIARERLCCPFFGFAVEIGPDGGPLRLKLTGPEGVKPFIRAEIGEALDEKIARRFGF